jgi:hypothetical protein
MTGYCRAYVTLPTSATSRRYSVWRLMFSRAQREPQPRPSHLAPLPRPSRYHYRASGRRKYPEYLLGHGAARGKHFSGPKLVSSIVFASCGASDTPALLDPSSFCFISRRSLAYQRPRLTAAESYAPTRRT